MSSWTIYGANGVAKATVKELELHDEWMAECFLTVTVKSHEPIDFEVGDYIDYRDERYSINYDPTILKKARRDTYGEGFVYDNIKFVSQQDEIVRCDFNDIVLSDNNMHYTMLPTFPFYCETVDDLLDRIQANLEELYPGGWIVISPDLAKDRQRGMCVGREQAFVDAYNQYIGAGSQFFYEKTGIALTANNNNCWEALKWANDQFGLNFFVRGRVVVVGTNGAVTGRKFRYGKGNGLYEIERISDSEQKIITRLRGYGAETNLPNHYYANLSKRCFATVTGFTGLNDEYYILDLDYNSSLFKKKDDEGNHWVTRIENDSEYGWANLYVLAYDHEEVAPSDGKTVVYPQTGVSFVIGQKIYFIGGIDVNQWPASNTEQAHQYMPDNMAINRLMLPGFPKKSLADWVEDHMDDERIQQMVEAGFTFSDDVYRPYIDSPNVSVYGIRPASIYFDGSDADSEDIHPTIEDMEWHGRRVDVIVSADQITDNGILPDDAKDSEKQMNVVIPKAGFELDELLTDEATIEMKDGMCGARSLKIKKVKEDESKNNWICTVQRAYDDTLKLFFPYKDFQIKGGTDGDHFVLTGIDLPESYIEAASEKLFFACVDALLANHTPRYTFQPRIDEIWMQRQHDTAKASGGAVESLHDTLKSGDLFSFADDDLGIDAKIIIDVLTIKENGNNGIPTYEVTLRDEKIASAIDKRLEKINSVISGMGGGFSARQYSGMIEAEGSDLFLSKIYDDVAQGVIGFLKGAWFGVKNWFIDSDGNANLNNTTVNGLLKAYNATINKVKSSNYNGDGMLDTGWQIINDFEGTDSYAVFDRLYIRKKATFEELEVRKWSGIGGNFICSPCAGVIWQIDYYDASGNILGYDDVKVPWTLFGRLLIKFMPHNVNNRYLGHVKRVKRPLTDAEKRLVRTIRCYTYNDDGTTQTMTSDIGERIIGAQMRCQTINKAKLDYDGSVWTGKHISNHYWWRLVQGYGSAQMSDGRVHDYVDFWVNLGSAEATAANEDTGSDWPEEGDVMVQMGHRTDAQLANIITLETSTADAPAIKEYRRVMSWDLNSRRKTMISPTSGNEFYATKFHIETEYEDVLIPADRGAWTQGMACAYYDRVSHNGSLWLCIAPNGTTIEPGDATAEQRSVWQRQVAKGDKGEAAFKSQVFKRSATKPAKPTGGSYSSPVPSGWSDGIPSGTDTIWMTTRIFSTDGQSPQQAAWTDVQLLSDTESFDVEFAKKTSDGNPPAAPNGHNQHGGDQTQVWFDPALDTTTDFTTMIWMAERTKSEGVWGAWKITKIKGEDGGFKSRVFKRTNTDISSQRPTGGTYDNPIPSSGGWTDGIPNNSEESLWSSVCTFWVDGTNSGWSLPARETDTSDVDIEYSKSATKPNAPTGSTPHTDHSSEGWYDPALHPTADWANMIWRAERKINNGAYSSGWVISKIKGEKGDDGIDATTTALKYTGPLAAGATAPTVATYKNFTWTDNIPTQTEDKPNVYVGVWEYTAGTTLDINTKAPKSVTIFAHYGKTGAAGRSVTNVNTYFKAAASTPSKPTGAPSSSGWADDGSSLITKANADAGYHLYESTCTTYSDGSYSWTAPLDDGAIADMAATSEEFALANSSTTAPTTGWSASVTPTSGKWIWSRTKLTFKSGDPKYVNTQCVGYCGTNGTNGTDGTSVTITSKSVTYQASSSGTTAPTGTWSTTVPSVDQGKFLWTKTYVKYSDGTETLSYAVAYRGIDGTNPIFADIENEMDSVACTSDGKTIKEYVRKVFVSLWKGSTKQTLTGITVSGAPTGATVTTNTTEGSVRMTIPANTSLAETTRMSIVLSASGISNQTVYFTLNGVRCGADGAIYTLVPTSNEVIRKKDGTIIPSNNIYCRVIKIVGKEYTTPSRSEYTLKVKIDGGSEQNYDLDGYEASAIHQSLEFILYIDGNVADRETVPAVEDGDNMTITSQSVTYQVSTSGTTVPTGTWSTTVPSVPQGQFLWTKTYVLYADGTSTTSYSVSYNAKNGTNGTNGTDGKNGTSIVPVPNAIVITQQKTTGGAQPLTNLNEIITVVSRDGGSIVASTISNLVATHCTANIINNGTTSAGVKITAVTKDSSGNYYTSGAVAFNVSATTAAGQTFTASCSVPFACNLLGTYVVEIEEDMKTEVAQKVTAEITAEGVLTSTNFDNKYNNASWGVKQDITKTINELKGNGTYDRTTGYTNSRLSTAEQNLSTLSNSLGQTNTRLETAEGNITTISSTVTTQGNAISGLNTRMDAAETRITNTNTRIDTAESSIQTLSSEIDTVDGKFSNYSTTSQTSTMISQEVASGTLATNVFNVSEWEQGSVDGDRGQTWDVMKINSSVEIRTKKLFPNEDQLCLIFSSESESVYKVAFIYFNINKVKCSTVWSGWKNMADHGTGNHRIEVNAPSDCVYVGILLGRINGGSIQPIDAKNSGISFISKQTATRSYVTNTADSVALGVQSDIEGKLVNTGININTQDITIQSNHVYFKDRDGNPAKFYINNEDGSMYAAGGGTIGGFVIGTSSLGVGADSNGNAQIDTSGHLYLNSGDSYSAITAYGGSFLACGQSSTNGVDVNSDNIHIYSNTIEIGSSLSGQQSYYDAATTTLKCKTVHKAFASFESGVAFGGSIINGSGLKDLPSNPVKGQTVLVKGTRGNITIANPGIPIMEQESGSTQNTYSCGQRSVMFIYDGEYWIVFYCG